MQKTPRLRFLVVPTVFLWVGFVGAISFMEAWLKFQAPGITLELGLGIGSLVFTALNRVELVLALLLIVSTLGNLPRSPKQWVWLTIPIAILLLDTVWLLPSLNTRASSIMAGVPLEKSNLHFFYVGFEVLKIVALVTYGILEIKNTQKNKSK